MMQYNKLENSYEGARAQPWPNLFVCSLRIDMTSGMVSWMCDENQECLYRCYLYVCGSLAYLSTYMIDT